MRDILGLLRLELGRPPITEGGLNFVWVTEFPLFESIDDQGRPIAAHHPFTMPHPDDVGLLDGEGEELLAVRSQAYDLVLNGWELGSGSVRIHRPDIQRAVFRALGISDEDAETRFGFLLDAFRYGAPPHAGFAFGIDRLVAILAGEENIREVIAFPKTPVGRRPAVQLAHPDCRPPPRRARPARPPAPRRWVGGGAPDGDERRSVCRRRCRAPGQDRAAGRPAPAEQPGRAGGPGAPARPGQAAAQPHRVGPAVVGHLVGAAGHGQDHHRPAGGRHYRPGLCPALRGGCLSQGRARSYGFGP